jgi:hypothetical protein
MIFNSGAFFASRPQKTGLSVPIFFARRMRPKKDFHSIPCAEAPWLFGKPVFSLLTAYPARYWLYRKQNNAIIGACPKTEVLGKPHSLKIYSRSVTPILGDDSLPPLLGALRESSSGGGQSFWMFRYSVTDLIEQ